LRPFALSFLAGFAIVLWGCSPFSRKSEPKVLFPADSLSRDIAASVPVEALALDWRTNGGESAYFSSILLGPDTTIWTGDLGRQSVRRFKLDGSELPATGGFTYPYLSGLRGRDVAVFDAGSNRVIFVNDPTSGVDLPATGEESAALSRQVALLDNVVYLKDAQPGQTTIYRLNTAGGDHEVLATLPGPVWHHFGVLRPWRGKLVSVSSYRPTLQTVEEGRIDSLHLDGFDSPMLARVRSYTLGEIDEPPLIISGVYGVGDNLYVLNLRPGYVRIDVFNADARLTRILQYESPEPTGFTPVDLVVTTDADTSRAFVASVNTVYGSLSLEYASRLDRFSFPTGAEE
jgi:hypothetical protein